MSEEVFSVSAAYARFSAPKLRAVAAASAVMVNNFFHNKVLSAHPDVPENLFSGRSDPFNISANCLRLSK